MGREVVRPAAGLEAADKREKIERLAGGANVVDADDRRAVHHGDEGARNASGQALRRLLFACDGADEPLARKRREERDAKLGEGVEARKERQILVGVLVDAEAGVRDEFFARDAGGDGEIDSFEFERYDRYRVFAKLQFRTIEL